MIYTIGVVVNDKVIAVAESLGSIPFFKRNKVRSLIMSSVKQFCINIKRGEMREAVSENELYFRGGAMRGLKGIIFFAIVDKSYSQYAFRMLIRRLTNRFEIIDQSRANECKQHLEEYIKIYSDPKNIDTISRVRENLEEVKEIMMKNIDLILERGVSIQHLLMKANKLNETSKFFYKSSQKHNIWCCSLFG